jgi:hypothetical protein
MVDMPSSGREDVELTVELDDTVREARVGTEIIDMLSSESLELVLVLEDDEVVR